MGGYDFISGDVRFVAELYNFRKFDEGTNFVIFWVNITDLPHDF
jgi:hypothetical protein